MDDKDKYIRRIHWTLVIQLQQNKVKGNRMYVYVMGYIL